MDGHLSFAEALAVALHARGFRVSGTAATRTGARDLAARSDIVLVAAHEGDDPLGLVRELRTDYPSVRVVLLAGEHRVETLERALKLSVAGYVLKSTPLEEVISALESAARDHAAIPSVYLSELMGSMHRREEQRRTADVLRTHLTDREYEILVMLARGLGTRAIADTLVLSVNTIRTHVQNVLSKLNAHTRLEAVNYALTSGLLPSPAVDDR